MRRRFFLLTAPAIVAAPSLMKVSAPKLYMARYVWKELRIGCITIQFDAVEESDGKVYFVDSSRYLYLRDGKEYTWGEAKALFAPDTPLTIDVSRRIA